MIRGRFWLLLLAPLGLLLAGCSGKPASRFLTPGSYIPGTVRRANIIGVHATPSGTDSLYMKFGAGADLRVTLSTPTNPDTTSFPGTSAPSDTTWWSYAWNIPAAIADQVEMSANETTEPANFVVLRGTSNFNINSATIRFDVRHHVKLLVKDPSDTTRYIRQEFIPDTVATGYVKIGFHRVPARDITGYIDVYHVVQSLAGSIAGTADSVTAMFINNDADRSELPAGNLVVAGAPLTQHHLTDGQEYSGTILFKIPQRFGFQTRDDPKSLVPPFNVSVLGPANELLVTSPDSRIPVNREHPPSLQWTGGNDSGVVNISLSDSYGHMLTIQALDNGRYDLSADQASVFTPGIMNLVLQRVQPTTFTGLADLPPLNLNIRLIEETHASFFYH